MAALVSLTLGKMQLGKGPAATCAHREAQRSARRLCRPISARVMVTAFTSNLRHARTHASSQRPTLLLRGGYKPLSSPGERRVPPSRHGISDADADPNTNPTHSAQIGLSARRARDRRVPVVGAVQCDDRTGVHVCAVAKAGSDMAPWTGGCGLVFVCLLAAGDKS